MAERPTLRTVAQAPGAEQAMLKNSLLNPAGRQDRHARRAESNALGEGTNEKTGVFVARRSVTEPRLRRLAPSKPRENKEANNVERPKSSETESINVGRQP